MKAIVSIMVTATVDIDPDEEMPVVRLLTTPQLSTATVALGEDIPAERREFARLATTWRIFSHVASALEKDIEKEGYVTVKAPESGNSGGASA